MRKRIKSGINYVLITLLTLLGILGVILPILPGIIFIAIALVILSVEMPFIDEKIDKYLNKEKKLSKMFYKLKDKISKYFK